jgi:hypothetical protein
MTMALRVVGAGLGRTGTNSLKVALERLLGGRCYHMVELIERPSDTEYWERAAAGEFVTWDWLRQDYVATVDFPAAMFWREIFADNPDAVVLLSTRESGQIWWDSFERTILYPGIRFTTRTPPPTSRRASGSQDPMRVRRAERLRAHLGNATRKLRARMPLATGLRRIGDLCERGEQAIDVLIGRVQMG